MRRITLPLASRIKEQIVDCLALQFVRRVVTADVDAGEDS